MTNRTRIVTISGVLCSVVCVAMLHVARTDLSPLSTRLSEYANEPYGWLMATAFVTLACGIAALGIGLWNGRGRDRRAWIILSAALLSSASTTLSGIFRTGASDISETIHSQASAVAVMSIVAVTLVHSAPFARDKAGEAPDPIGGGIALIAAFLVTISPVLHHTRWTGLSQRLLWIAVTIWLLRTARLGRPVPSHTRDSERAVVRHSPSEY